MSDALEVKLGEGLEARRVLEVFAARAVHWAGDSIHRPVVIIAERLESQKWECHPGYGMNEEEGCELGIFVALNESDNLHGSGSSGMSGKVMEGQGV